jgi:hypothetical protein
LTVRSQEMFIYSIILCISISNFGFLKITPFYWRVWVRSSFFVWIRSGNCVLWVAIHNNSCDKERSKSLICSKMMEFCWSCEKIFFWILDYLYQYCGFLIVWLKVIETYSKQICRNWLWCWPYLWFQVCWLLRLVIVVCWIQSSNFGLISVDLQFWSEANPVANVHLKNKIPFVLG